MNDQQKIDEGMSMLSKLGVFARSNFKCCQTCALYSISADFGVPDDGAYCFYHEQDAEAFGKNGDLQQNLMLRYGSNEKVGWMIVGVFTGMGFKVIWDGDMGHAIEVGR